jgi:hypothetical protein
MKRRVPGISTVLSLIFLIYSCRQSPLQNHSIQSESDSITIVDTISFMQPTPPFHYRDSVVSKKYYKNDLSKEYVNRSKTVRKWDSKFWYLNEAIMLDTLNAEAYYERGILKSMLESTFPPISGCPDICHAKKLGYPIPNGASIVPSCDCEKVNE